MSSKVYQIHILTDKTQVNSWIPLQRIETIIQAELLFLVLALALSSWLFYRLFLKGISPSRHHNLGKLFKNVLIHSANLLAFSICFWMLRLLPDAGTAIGRLIPYLGLLALTWGCIVLIKTMRIATFEYLFLQNMKSGVPVLIVNILTLIFSLLLCTWVLSGVFDFKLAPLLATSAIFSIVLGLALQETLGNLMAGVAMQFDKPYEIGDWIEVSNGPQKWVGQVYEISWRATMLVALGDEWISVPNRNMAASQVLNFSAKVRPFTRSHFLHLPFGSDLKKAEKIMLDSATTTPGVSRHPKPLALITDTTGSYIIYKLIYYVEDYGRQMLIADELLHKVLVGLEAAGLSLAPEKFHVETSPKT